jgi:hypothetical protein
MIPMTVPIVSAIAFLPTTCDELNPVATETTDAAASLAEARGIHKVPDSGAAELFVLTP